MNHLTSAQLREHLLIEEESALIEQASLALQRRHTNRYSHMSVAQVLRSFELQGFSEVRISRGKEGVVVSGVAMDVPDYLQETA